MRESRVVIIGAGPSGLAAAACLKRRGVEALVLDRTGQPGGAYARMYGGVLLASPTRMNGLPGVEQGLAAEYATAAEYAAYLRRYAEQCSLVPERAEVLRVERGFVVHTDSERIAARAVVVATGMWDFPVRLPGVSHASEWQGPKGLRSLLVIGGGTSAVELATEAAQAGVQVTISSRSPVRPLPRKILGVEVHDVAVLLEKIPAALSPGYCDSPPRLNGSDDGFSRLKAEGRIVVRGPATLQGRSALFQDGTRLEADAMVAATGYRFDTPFLPPEVRRSKAGHLKTKHGESVSWPGLFVLGSPCAAGLDSQYLRGIARDAERLAARLS